MRVLAAEDDALVLTLLEEALTERGHRPVLAQNGQEALQHWAHEGPFDALITDMSMPHLNGDSLVALLRAQRPSLPVVILTGYDLADERHSDVGMGNDRTSVLQKPVTIERVLDELERVAAL